MTRPRPAFAAVHRCACECVRLADYVMTLHAEEEMARDDFSVFDIEHAILNGRIVLRQKDTETKQWKYVIRGPGLSARSLDVVFRLSRGRRLIIITVFAVRHRNGMSS